MSVENPLVICEIDGHVAHIRLNRPDAMNALSEEMADTFVSIVEGLERQSEVRVAVLSGVGRSFCAGGDLSMLDSFTDLTVEQGAERMYAFYTRYLKLRDMSIPVIAAVHGAAIGAGACLMLACDLRVADAHARIAFNFVKLGLHPGLGATELLPRTVGEAKATELLLGGETIHGEEAERIGLVHRSAIAGSYEASALAWAKEIARNGPLACRLLKEGMRKRLDPARLEAALRHEALSQARCYQTDDFREGISAVREKRLPHFHDR